MVDGVVEELAEQEGSSRLADIARGVEAGEGVEDEDAVGGGGGAAAAAVGRDRLTSGSVGRADVSVGVAVEVVVGSARRHAPWTPVWLEAEELD